MCRAGTDAISSSPALRRAGPDRWTTPLVPVGVQKFDSRWEEAAGRQALLRGRDASVFGMVTDACEAIPKEEAGAFLESLVGEGLAMFHTAGSLFGGRRVLVCCHLPESLELGPDQVDQCLVALWGQDDAEVDIQCIL
jgi:hypothetical protein